ncbi:MAG: nitrile hydratase [Gammaproteobacteria bacterium]|jgi:nitrile hydratase
MQTKASPEQRTEALKQILEDQGLLPEGALAQIVHDYEEDLHWRNGAKVVAKAWTDTDYRQRLLADGTKACAELGFEGIQGEYIVALECLPTTHHAVVCTQCSCTPWPVLGLPPNWYKSPEYRARVVRNSRQVLKELGLDLEGDVNIQVWDTTAETRYIVLPLQPAETLGWDEEALINIISREAMFGIAQVKP